MATPIGRAPGSFSPMISAPQNSISHPALRRVESSSDDDFSPSSLNLSKQRPPPQRALAQIFSNSGHNSSTGSLTNFSRPPPLRTDVPRKSSPALSAASSTRSPILDIHRHGRKHSQTQGSFEAFLPTAAHSNLGSMGNLDKALSASMYISLKPSFRINTRVLQAVD